MSAFNPIQTILIPPVSSSSPPSSIPVLLHPQYDLYLLRSAKNSNFTLFRTFTPHAKVTAIMPLVEDEKIQVGWVDNGVYCFCRGDKGGERGGQASESYVGV